MVVFTKHMSERTLVNFFTFYFKKKTRGSFSIAERWNITILKKNGKFYLLYEDESGTCNYEDYLGKSVHSLVQLIQHELSQVRA